MRYYISFILELPKTSLWDISLVFMQKRPYQASSNHYSKLLLSGAMLLCDQSAHEQDAGLPLHIANFLGGKTQPVMFMVLASGSEWSQTS